MLHPSKFALFLQLVPSAGLKSRYDKPDFFSRFLVGLKLSPILKFLSTIIQNVPPDFFRGEPEPGIHGQVFYTLAVGFKSPPQLVIAQKGFDRQTQIGGVDHKVTIGFVFFRSGTYHQMDRLRTHAGTHLVMDYRQRLFKTGDLYIRYRSSARYGRVGRRFSFVLSWVAWPDPADNRRLHFCGHDITNDVLGLTIP